MKVFDTPDIRNVALIGHGDSGKTSLASALLFASGAVNRMGSVDEGTAIRLKVDASGRGPSRRRRGRQW